MMQLKTRRAREEDITFLGWVMYTVARSHLFESLSGVIFGQSEAGTRSLLERVSKTPALHWFSASKSWVVEGVENAAVLPEYHGKGLIDRLFEQVLGEGRERVFKHAQILCLIGNEPGQRAYERNRFETLTQQKSTAFEELIEKSGDKRLDRDL